MTRFSTMIRIVFNFLKTHKLLVLFGVVILFILLTNTFHEKYPDEFDSIVGGKYILQGKIPYRDWFQHHQPGAYVLAAGILLFSGTSFVRFRIGLAIAYFLIHVTSYYLLRRRLGGHANLAFFLSYILIAAFAGTYYWGQMLLADTLAALLVIPPLALLFVKEYSGERYEIKDVLFVSLYGFLVWFTSMTYIIVVAVLTAFVWWSYMRVALHSPERNKLLARSVGIIAAPYILFFLFFLLTGSIKEYYFANITYNSNHYIYNYTRPHGTPVNPVRYAIVIAHDSLEHYRQAITGVAGFPFGDPLNMTLAVSTMAVIVYFALRGRFLFGVVLIFVLIYENARGNPQAIKETDYQSGMYILTSLVSGMFVLWATYTDMSHKKINSGQKVLFGIILSIVSIYSLFNVFFLGMRWFGKVYDKYMGTMPLIYDRPVVAPILNRVLTSNDYAWVGPFEFEELFYLNEKAPSKYHWFLDHAAESKKIMSEMISDFNTHHAAIIVFNRSYSPWGSKAETFNSFFTDYLDKNYVRLVDINTNATGMNYKWKNPIQGNFDLESMVHFEKSRANELIHKLLEMGYLELRPKSVVSK
jgi:hypothetical protein